MEKPKKHSKQRTEKKTERKKLTYENLLVLQGLPASIPTLVDIPIPPLELAQLAIQLRRMDKLDELGEKIDENVELALTYFKTAQRSSDKISQAKILAKGALFYSADDWRKQADYLINLQHKAIDYSICEAKITAYQLVEKEWISLNTTHDIVLQSLFTARSTSDSKRRNDMIKFLQFANTAFKNNPTIIDDCSIAPLSIPTPIRGSRSEFSQRFELGTDNIQQSELKPKPAPIIGVIENLSIETFFKTELSIELVRALVVLRHKQLSLVMKREKKPKSKKPKSKKTKSVK